MGKYELMKYLLFWILIICMSHIQLNAVDEKIIEYNLEKFIPLISNVGFRNYYIPELKPGNNLLTDIFINTNNINGFTLKLSSQNNGTLIPQDDYSNLPPINYGVFITKEYGNIDPNIIDNENIIHTQLSPELPAHLIYTIGAPESPLKLKYKLYLKVYDSDNYKLEMAGNYIDEITLHFLDN